MVKLVLIMIACLLVTNIAMATVFYGYTPLADNLWSNPANWAGDTLVAPHNPPAAGDTAMVWDGKSVVVNYAAPEFLVFRGRAGSATTIEAGGSLQFYAGWAGDNAGSGAVSQIIVNGGSLTATRTDDVSPGIRLAEGARSNAILTVNSGVVTTRGMQVGSEVTGNCTAKVKLYGGEIDLLMNSNASLYLYSYGTMDVRKPGKLVMAGNRTVLLNLYLRTGEIFSSDSNAILSVSYDSNLDKTTLQDIHEVTLPPDQAVAIYNGIVPNIAVDGMGHVVYVWSADTANSLHPQNLYYCYSINDGASFSLPALFPFYGNSLSYINVQPNLLYDRTGKLNFAWSLVTDTMAPVYTKSMNYGLSWRPKVETANLGYNVYPRNDGIALAASEDGEIIKIAWYNCASGDSTKRVYYGLSTDGGTTWSTTNITTLVGAASSEVSYMSSAVMDDNGDFYALSKKNNKLNLLRLIGSTWSSVDIIPTNTSISLANEHSIVVNESGKLFIVWSQDGRVYTKSSADKGSSWNGNVIIDSSINSIQEKPVIGLDSYGELVTAWQDTRTGKRQIRWAQSEDEASTWSQSKVVQNSSEDQNDPDMAIEGRKVHIVWIEKGCPVYSSIRRPISGDVDENGHIDLADFGLLATNWKETENLDWQKGDLNGDSIVNIIDMAILGEFWLNTEIPARSHLPLYNNDNQFPNSTFDEFVNGLPAGWSY